MELILLNGYFVCNYWLVLRNKEINYIHKTKQNIN